jgi:hypothetical protein
MIEMKHKYHLPSELNISPIKPNRMKLEKLLTLSQMLVWLHKGRPFAEDLSEGSMSELSDMMAFLIKYHNFLKQPLTKEMFVSESETEMIFTLKERRIEETWREYFIPRGSDCIVEYCEFMRGVCSDRIRFMARNNKIETLDDLAEATNGELILKNTTI